MTQELREIEASVRRRFQEDAQDLSDIDAMRARVLAALTGAEVTDLVIAPATTDRPKRRALLGLAGAAATILIAAAGILALSRDEPVGVATSPPTESEPALVVDWEYESEILRTPIALSAPVEGAGEWALVSESESVLTLEFVDPQGADGGSVGRLRIVAPPPGTSDDEVAATLNSTLFDTALVSDRTSSIGGLPSRAIRLATEAGTTRLGFKLATDTYVQTEGSDRSFTAHIVSVDAKDLVFWLESAPDELPEFESIAGRLLASVK